MKKQSKKYSRPRKPFDKIRIDEENILKEKYGLKNKKEIWKADAAIGRIRNLAKQLITKSEDEKKASRLKPKKKIVLVNSKVKPIFPEGYQINERYDFSDQMAMIIVKIPNPVEAR